MDSITQIIFCAHLKIPDRQTAKSCFNPTKTKTKSLKLVLNKNIYLFIKWSKI